MLTAVFQWGWGIEPRRASTPTSGTGADRELRAADDVRGPLRALDGLPGLPAVAGSTQHRAAGRGATATRSGDGLASSARVIAAAALIMIARVRQLRPERRPDREAVRRGPLGGGRTRRGRACSCSPRPSSSWRDAAAGGSPPGSTASCPTWTSRAQARRPRHPSKRCRRARPPPPELARPLQSPRAGR